MPELVHRYWCKLCIPIAVVIVWLCVKLTCAVRTSLLFTYIITQLRRSCAPLSTAHKRRDVGVKLL